MLMGGIGSVMVCVVSLVKHAGFSLGHLNSPSDLLKAFACDPSAPSNSGKVNSDKASSAIGPHSGACAPETDGREVLMNIGQASKASGVSAKMIRYYESVDLIPAADRKASGYRDYAPEDIHRLGFIRRARDLGFSIEQIRDLLRLWSDRQRSNAEVKRIALQHVAALKERAKHLNELADTLKHLAAACEGDGRPECPIIKGLEGQVPIEVHCSSNGAIGPHHATPSAGRPRTSRRRLGTTAVNARQREEVC
jgi:MerR family copper efflux transcriptional regulator